MKKRYKVFLWLIIYFIVISIGLFTYFKYLKQENPEEEQPINEIKITNSIEKYGYHLEDRDTQLFKEKFEQLKELLDSSEESKEEYIKLVSELFIIDLYSINNKISRYDVGGLEYVYSGAQESFRTVIQNTIYKTVENNLDDTRSQKLPTVSSIEIENLEETTYIMPDESTANGYKVNLSWTYEELLGYDDKAVIILVPDGEKMGIVFYKAKN